VLIILRTDTSDTAKVRLRQALRRAGWDDDVRMGILGIRSRNVV
jgi:hypothetical protein